MVRHHLDMLWMLFLHTIISRPPKWLLFINFTLIVITKKCAYLLVKSSLLITTKVNDLTDIDYSNPRNHLSGENEGLVLIISIYM